MWMRWFALLLSIPAVLACAGQRPLGPPQVERNLKVHDPIVYSNLALFPVTGVYLGLNRDYLTLDEGLRSGEVEVTELGAALIRHQHDESARVNTLALINHSKKPLVLLAGEIVTGGKQDRVISKDRIIPPGAEPLPLDVFCVEPGRWHGASMAFEGKSFMAAPTVREKAAVARDQQAVWDATGEVRNRVAEAAGAPAAGALQSSSSYAQLERSEALKGRIDKASDDLQRDYERALRGALGGKDVVGVVVAINGEVVWADLFAEPDLFERYWPKLLRSYVVEALGAPGGKGRASVREAERFLFERGGRQVIEVEPGEFRLTQIDHSSYTIYQLSSLLEKREPMVHWAKLQKERAIPIRPMHRDR